MGEQLVVEEYHYEVGWADALQEQFGSVPWWMTSAAVHVTVLVLLTLVTVSTPQYEPNHEIIPLDLVKTVDPVVDQPKVRDRFDSNKEVDMPNIVEDPILVHEEAEVDDHFVTENNMEMDNARGEEDAISDVPTGGTGVVAAIGLDGGGAGCFGTRDGGGKRKAIKELGGSRRTESAVRAALRWLAHNQEPDGRWAVQKWEGRRSEDAHIGVTGLAMLAFLGAGHTERVGEFKNTVRRATLYLISKQDNRGMIGRNDGHQHGGGYNHAIAGLALAEAYGMGRVKHTGIAAQKAVDFTINNFQREYSGWRYKPGGSDADTSVTGWFIMQLKSALISGLKVDGRGFQGAIAWLDKVTEKGDGGSGYGGRASYQPGRNYTTTMTAVAGLGRLFMGWKPNDPLMTGVANHLVENLPEWNSGPSWMFYYWYYGSLCMIQIGGDWWKSWNVSMADMLVEHQINDPGNKRLDGSWDPIRDGQQGGRAYSTAMCCLCLEVYYRY